MSDFQKDNVALMCDIGELAGLFDFESGLDGFLARAVSTVAWHMRAAVCSIYLYEAERQELSETADRAADALECLLTKGVEQAMNGFN